MYSIQLYRELEAGQVSDSSWLDQSSGYCRLVATDILESDLKKAFKLSDAVGIHIKANWG